jgi:hypothetical protein
MSNIKWSKKEKAVARQAFSNAYKKECKELARRVREMSNTVNTPEDIWQLHDFLKEKRREIDVKYDFRYSVLILVFGRLLREGWIEVDDLEGLDEEKITKIKYVAEL